MSCPACFSGGITTSHPTGKESTIHGLPTYIAEPAEGITPKGVIVFLTDGFGWKFVNNRVLCDHYAQKGGYMVYCSDFMDGNAMDPLVIPLMDKVLAGDMSVYPKVLEHAGPWKVKTDPALTYPGVLAFMKALRATEPPFPTSALKIGVAGVCWGGKHAFTLAAENETLVDAVFTGHPSYIEVPKDVEHIKVPMSVAIGDVDQGMKLELVLQMKELLEKKNVDGEKKFVVTVVKGGKHGFAIRTHPDDKAEMKCAEEAEIQALEWFAKWLI